MSMFPISAPAEMLRLPFTSNRADGGSL